MPPPHLEGELPDDSKWMNRAREHDAVLHLHCIVVSDLTSAFCDYLGVAPLQQRRLVRAALLHDIGKLRIPAPLLQKTGPLTAEEFSLVRAHSTMGYEMLREAGETDEVLLHVTRDHHERLDGTGYPRNLLEPEISAHVRIVTLCDVYAAITEYRPYAPALPCEEALRLMFAKRTRLDMPLLEKFAAMMVTMKSPKSDHNSSRSAQGE